MAASRLAAARANMQAASAARAAGSPPPAPSTPASPRAAVSQPAPVGGGSAASALQTSGASPAARADAVRRQMSPAPGGPETKAADLKRLETRMGVDNAAAVSWATGVYDAGAVFAHEEKLVQTLVNLVGQGVAAATPVAVKVAQELHCATLCAALLDAGHEGIQQWMMLEAHKASANAQIVAALRRHALRTKDMALLRRISADRDDFLMDAVTMLERMAQDAPPMGSVGRKGAAAEAAATAAIAREVGVAPRPAAVAKAAAAEGTADADADAGAGADADAAGTEADADAGANAAEAAAKERESTLIAAWKDRMEAWDDFVAPVLAAAWDLVDADAADGGAELFDMIMEKVQAASPASWVPAPLRKHAEHFSSTYKAMLKTFGERVLRVARNPVIASVFPPVSLAAGVVDLVREVDVEAISKDALQKVMDFGEDAYDDFKAEVQEAAKQIGITLTRARKAGRKWWCM